MMTDSDSRSLTQAEYQSLTSDKPRKCRADSSHTQTKNDTYRPYCCQLPPIHSSLDPATRIGLTKRIRCGTGLTKDHRYAKRPPPRRPIDHWRSQQRHSDGQSSHPGVFEGGATFEVVVLDEVGYIDSVSRVTPCVLANYPTRDCVFRDSVELARSEDCEKQGM